MSSYASVLESPKQKFKYFIKGKVIEKEEEMEYCAWCYTSDEPLFGVSSSGGFNGLCEKHLKEVWKRYKEYKIELRSVKD